MPAISATFHLTHACNLRCSYCYTGEKSGAGMTAATAREAVKFAHQAARDAGAEHLEIVFFGGEPLLRHDLLCDIVDQSRAQSQGLRVSFKMSTNGLLLSEGVIADLASREVFVSLSIDGEPATQDAQRPDARGAGSAGRLAEIIPRVLAWNPHTAVNCVITPLSAERADASVRWLFAQGIRYVSTALDWGGAWTRRDLRALGAAYVRLGEWYVRETLRNSRFYLSCFDEKIRTRTRGPLELCERCALGHRQFSIFPNDRPLRVRPVRSYRVPRYPSHTDPDPTTTPEPVPYPWRSGLAATLLALGEAGCNRGQKAPDASTSAQAQQAQPSHAQPKPPSPAVELDAIIAEVMREAPKGVENPFALRLGFSGLPYVSGPYGTGAPTPLDSAAAQTLIRRLFAAEGLDPQPTDFKEDGFTASADGYDPEQRIGFIIGDWDSLGEKALSNWLKEELVRAASEDESLKPPAKAAEDRERFDRLVAMIFERDQLDESQRKELAAIAGLESLRAKGRAYRALAAKIDEPRLSMAEIERAEKMAADRQRYLAVISVLDTRFQPSDRWMNLFATRYVELENEASQRTFADDKKKQAWIARQLEAVRMEQQQDHLITLARAVREYIAWARRNGLQ